MAKTITVAYIMRLTAANVHPIDRRPIAFVEETEHGTHAWGSEQDFDIAIKHFKQSKARWPDLELFKITTVREEEQVKGIDLA